MSDNLTLVSALLGGFSFTFLGSILNHNDGKRITAILVVLSVLAATMFFLCTLGWSFFDEKVDFSEMSDLTKSKHKYLSKIFFIGILLFNVLLGLSGWKQSKMVGYVTTLIAVFAMFSLAFIFKGSIT
ncbi:MAG: hypothetical protein GC193_11100 [Cryomorphaceae bacterium]|nr:hypothetical protein [Cryomorphaceae bacterium]